MSRSCVCWCHCAHTATRHAMNRAGDRLWGAEVLKPFCIDLQVVIKTVEHDLSPNSLSALRFLIAAVVFSPLAAKGLKNAGLRLAALELGTWLFLGYTAQVLGLEYTTAAKGAFTGTFTVLAVPLLVGFSGRKVPLTTWASALVALVGAQHICRLQP